MPGETQAQRITGLEARVLRIETQLTERALREDEYVTELKVLRSRPRTGGP
jgi:hypothetical protein